jgi:hypothetical protein
MTKLKSVFGISFLCFVSLPAIAREPPKQSDAACPSLYDGIAARIDADPELRSLHLDQKSCSSLRKLAAVLGNRDLPHHPEPTQVAGLASVAAIEVPPKATQQNTVPPKHGTAEYAQQNAQRFYVRQNALDAFYYLYPSIPDPKNSGSSSDSSSSASKASGANLSWTNDRLNRSQVFNIQAYTGFVVARQLDLRPSNDDSTPYVSKWAIAPWLYANGLLDQPAKTTDKSALQFGGETQIEVSRLGPFAITDVRFAPYYQTDFRGIANIQGIDALVEPYNLGALLGGADHAISDLMFFYWRLIGEADIRHVTAAGLTNMKSDTEYAWLGGSLQFKASFFPNSPNSTLANRIYLTGTAQWFDSLSAQPGLQNYVAELGYNLDPAGTSSISLQYSHGTDKSTLVKADQYKAQLNFKM